MGKAPRSQKSAGPEPGSATAAPGVEARVVAQARPLAESLCASGGMELVHLEYRRERGGRVMRLYIDKPGGVTLEDCADVSRELGDILDVHLPEIGRYHLEVSSPGPNRPLVREGDFDRFRGRRVKIRTANPIDGRRNFSGVLEGLSEGEVRLNTGKATVGIAVGRISKAQLMDSHNPAAPAPPAGSRDGSAARRQGR